MSGKLNSNPNVLEVVFASNRNYFCGLLATFVSLLESNKRNAFCIHIIDGGLTRKQKNVLSHRITRRNSGDTLVFHPMDSTKFHGMRKDYGNSYMTYARIMMASFVKTSRVLYLDTDLLVAADVRPLWMRSMGNCIIAAARDRDIKRVADDFPNEGHAGDAPYFNAGVMLVNLDGWREFQAETKLLRMLSEAPEKYRWWDQTAMNVLFQGNVLFVEDEWNTFADSIDLTNVNDGKIFHYVGQSKPWNKFMDLCEFQLWRAFYGQYVQPRATLFRDRKFTLSFLLNVRHRLLCRSRLFRFVAAGAIAIKGWLMRKNPRAALTQFLMRHSPDAVRNSGMLDDHDKIRAYMRSRWSDVL